MTIFILDFKHMFSNFFSINLYSRLKMAEPSVDPNVAQLRRFLYLGDESKVYPQSITYPFISTKVQSIFDTLKSSDDGVHEIKRVFRDGHYLGLEPIIYSLAVFATSEQKFVKSLALETAREICLSATAMFTFTHFYKELSKPAKGWGRGLRNFVISWYNKKDPKDLAIEATKVKTCYKWTHKDILCMAHVKPRNPGNYEICLFNFLTLKSKFFPEYRVPIITLKFYKNF